MRIQTENRIDRKDSQCNHPRSNHRLPKEEFPFFNIAHKEGVYGTVHAGTWNEWEKSRDKEYRYRGFEIACC